MYFNKEIQYFTEYVYLKKKKNAIKTLKMSKHFSFSHCVISMNILLYVNSFITDCKQYIDEMSIFWIRANKFLFPELKILKYFTPGWHFFVILL